MFEQLAKRSHLEARMARRILIGAALTLCCVAAAALAQTTFPLMPSMSADADGTLHWSTRTIPLPAMESAEARTRYVEILRRHLAVKLDAAGKPILQRGLEGANAGSPNDAALKVFPVDVQNTEMGGVKVTVYTAKDMPARNRKRVVMNFNSDPVGIILAGIGKMKVIAVHYMPTTPKGNNDIVAVYRALLQTYTPSQIAWVGLSGGCQFGGNTAMWLPEQQLPFPAAIALMTCAGGRMPGDTRNTMNGLDAQLSDFTAFRSANPQTAPPLPAKPGEPQSEILNAPSIPKGFPPSYLLAGTRDMSLSHTVILHRRLKHAGVETELNIFEGMWHGFNMEPDLPETRDATTDLARFLDQHMGS
jgi:hypothetical protein